MTADPMIHCGRGICAAEEGHAGTCDEVSGWAEEEESDVRPVSPAQDAVSDAEAAAAAAAYEAGLLGGMSREERAARHAALARGAESVPSAAQVGAESITVDVRRWASHMADRLDQAEAENARLTEALYLTRITLEATFRVLQEASGLPDDIDDPDCRDEMVLALRPRAEKAEAENARLVDRIERLSAEYEADLPESMAGDERLRRVFDDHANDVLGLLSDEDEGGE